MAEVALQKYMNSALDVLKKFGIVPSEKEQSPLENLLQGIVQVDEARVMAIAQTVRYSSSFNEMVRGNVADIKFSDRYNAITKSFDSILEDANMLKTELADGKIDWKEKMKNSWMKLTRGSTHKRFEGIRSKFLDVEKDTKVSVDKEDAILKGYADFRTAMKESERMAFEVMQTQQKNLENSLKAYQDAESAVSAYTGTDAIQRSSLQQARDIAKRKHDDEDRNYQLIKDVSDFMSQGYVISEALMAKLKQKRDAQDQLYRRGVVFFQTNETVFTTLDALFAAEMQEQEATQTIEAEKQVLDKGMKYISTSGTETDKKAIETGYGSMYNVDTVKGLLNSIVEYHTWQTQRVGELREQNTKDTQEMHAAYEDTQKRLGDIVTKYAPSK